MKSYVITIKDLQQSVAAANRCITSGEKYGVNIEKWEAITPKSNPEKIAKEHRLPLENFIREGNKYSRYKNVLSAFLSHYSLWVHCISLAEPIRIFEHDAVIKSTLPDISMYGKKCISLGAPSYGKYNTPPLMGINKLTSKAYFPGAHAYQINPKGAKELVKRAKIDAGPTDVYLHIQRFPWLEEFFPWPVIAQDNFTTIQTERGCLAKHNWKNGIAYEIL